jgi:hypothetical protein
VPVHGASNAGPVPEGRHLGRVGVDAQQAVARLRRRGFLRDVGGVVDFGLHARVDGLELGRGHALGAGAPLDVAVERVVLAGPALDLAGGNIGLVVVLGVALPPVGHQLDQGHAFPAAGPRHGVTSDLVRRDHVVAVRPHARDAVAGGLVGQPLGRALLRRGRGVGVAIVLDDDDQRAALHRGEVDALVEGPGRGGAVAHVHQSHPRIFPELERQRGAGHDLHQVPQVRDLTDEVPLLDVAEVDVELAAAGRRVPLGHVLAQDLERSGTLHQHRAQVPDERGQHVLRPERVRAAHRTGLLAE